MLLAMAANSLVSTGLISNPIAPSSVAPDGGLPAFEFDFLFPIRAFGQLRQAGHQHGFDEGTFIGHAKLSGNIARCLTTDGHGL